ncbi:hypothetical protein, partial [Tabrizicola sp.]|uniref:hypothetical protein n=1 Tax=Tabrizicola sp. TaxID=2005166 RepID=UPI003F3DA7FE
MNVIAPNAANRTSTAAPALGTGPLGKPRRGGGRVQDSGARSKEKYRGIAKDDAKFEDFAFALTGKTAKERTPQENRALAQLRKEMAAGQIDPAFIEADPANGPGDDKLPSGARGAYVSGDGGEQGKVLISGSLRGQQLQKTSDEEMGEAVSDRASDLGIGVADGDAGARVGGVANGRKVTRDSDPALFRNQASDTINVMSDGEIVQAEADAGGPNIVVDVWLNPGMNEGQDTQVQVLDDNGKWVTVASTNPDDGAPPMDEAGHLRIAVPSTNPPISGQISPDRIRVRSWKDGKATDQAYNSATQTPRKDAGIPRGQAYDFNAGTEHDQAAVVGVSLAPSTPANWIMGGNGKYHDLSTAEGQQAHMKSFDTDASGQLDKTEFQAAMTSIDGTMTPERADRLMRLYGGTTDNKNYYVPVGPAPGPVWAGTGTDKMFADGIVQKNPSGAGYITDLGQVDPDTVANALTRYTAIQHYKESGNQGQPGEWIARFQTNGMTAQEMDWATDHVLGDTKPFDEKNGHRDVVVANFGTTDAEGTERINTNQLTAAVERGAISIKPGNTTGDWIAFSAHREVVPKPATPAPATRGVGTPAANGPTQTIEMWFKKDAKDDTQVEYFHNGEWHVAKKKSQGNAESGYVTAEIPAGVTPDQIRVRNNTTGAVLGSAGPHAQRVLNPRGTDLHFEDRASGGDGSFDDVNIRMTGKTSVPDVPAGENIVAGPNGVVYNLDNPVQSQAYFTLFDANKDGSLDPVELANALGISEDRAKVLNRLYGVGDNPDSFMIPLHSQSGDGMGMDDMLADKTLTTEVELPSGEKKFVTDFHQPSAETMGNAMIRAEAARRKQEAGSKDTRPIGDFILEVDRQGMTSDQLSWASGHVTGDTQPLDVHDKKHAKALTDAFGTAGADGTVRVNGDDVVNMWQTGALQLYPVQDKDHFIGISAHSDVTPTTQIEDGTRSEQTEVTHNWYGGGFTNLWLPTSALDQTSDGLNVHDSPTLEHVTPRFFFWVEDDYPVPPEQLSSELELNSKGQPTGNVVWTIKGTQRQEGWGGDHSPVTLVVPKGSEQDQYLKDYKAFGTPPPVGSNRPIANVERSGQAWTQPNRANRTPRNVEIWTPRHNQFTTGADGKNAEVTETPIFTIDGERATVESAQPVILRNGQKAYSVTVRTP